MCQIPRSGLILLHTPTIFFSLNQEKRRERDRRVQSLNWPVKTPSSNLGAVFVCASSRRNGLILHCSLTYSSFKEQKERDRRVRSLNSPVKTPRQEISEPYSCSLEILKPRPFLSPPARRVASPRRRFSTSPVFWAHARVRRGDF